jgi:Phosphatidylglycerol lysyltransferase, C-terminal
MLTEAQCERIRAAGRHTMHDHWFASLLYGEAFLDDDLLAYFDGRALTLCAFAVGELAPVHSSRIREWAVRWVRQTGADSMMLVTPACPDLRALQSLGLQRMRTWPARPITRELIATCPANADSLPPHRIARRALALPYEVRIRAGGAIDANQLALIERFTRFTGLTPYLAGLTMAWPAMMSHQRVHFVEAWRNGSLAGLLAMHQAFENGFVAVAMARDTNARGVTDFLYAHMLNHASAMGCAWVNLCSSPTRGHHAFKLKWAEPSPLAAYALTEWRHPLMARRYHYLWGPRTIRLSAPA